MIRILSSWLQYLLVMVVFVCGTAMPLLANPLPSPEETEETQPQDQLEQAEPTLPRNDIIPPPDPEPEPLVPEARGSDRSGRIFPQPMEPGLPPPPMPRPMEPGLPVPPMPQPAEPHLPDQPSVPEV